MDPWKKVETPQRESLVCVAFVIEHKSYINLTIFCRYWGFLNFNRVAFDYFGDYFGRGRCNLKWTCGCPNTSLFSSASFDDVKGCRMYGLNESSCCYRLRTSYQLNLAIPWKHINLSGWLHWPYTIDYIPSRLEWHWNTNSDQILHGGWAVIPLSLISLPCFVLSSKWTLTVARQKWKLQIFSHITLNIAYIKEIKCCRNQHFTHQSIYIFWISYHSGCSGTDHYTPQLFWHSCSLIYHLILLFEKVSWGQNARGTENSFQPGIHLLISYLCSLLSATRERK